MVDRTIIENMLKGAGFPEANIASAMALLFGEAPPSSNGRLLNMNEAMAFLGGVSRWTIMRAVHTKELRCVSLGRRVMFHPDDLNGFIVSHRGGRRKRVRRGRRDQGVKGTSDGQISMQEV